MNVKIDLFDDDEDGFELEVSAGGYRVTVRFAAMADLRINGPTGRVEIDNIHVLNDVFDRMEAAEP